MSASDPVPVWVTPHPEGSVLSLTVVPRSSRTAIEGDSTSGLRVRLTAPPVDGAANAMLIKVLSEALQLPRSRLKILSGETGRKKRILLMGMSAQDAHLRLNAAMLAS